MPLIRLGRRAGGAAHAAVARWLPRRRARTLGDLWDAITPAQLLLVSFAGLIVLGTLGLRWLPGLYTGERLGWVDALFTATSAVCVTGLAVVDTATFFTPLGQGWILLLIQLGGLGLLTLTSLILLTVGRRLSLRHERSVSSGGEALPEVDVRTLVRTVLRTTFAIEAIGAVLLYAGFVSHFGWVGAIWPSIFHAISAFCNAGFSTFTLSLMEFARSPLILGTIMALIVLGGFGFLALGEAADRLRRDPVRRRRRLSLHTRLVLAGTVVAILLGWVTFGYFEWQNTLAALSPPLKVLNALFGSITARTAGFNTVDYGLLTAPAALATMILMFIGGGAGSTAGGIKISTIAVLFALMVARLRGHERVSAWHRSVPDETIGRAIGLAILATSTIVAGLFLLIAIEVPAGTHAADAGEFIRYAFETVSAFGTVGLSMNTTPTLSAPARVLIVALMFIGRVGILSVGAAIALGGGRRRNFRYAYEDVAIG